MKLITFMDEIYGSKKQPNQRFKLIFYDIRDKQVVLAHLSGADHEKLGYFHSTINMSIDRFIKNFYLVESKENSIKCPNCESKNIFTMSADTYECNKCGCMFLLQKGKKYSQILEKGNN